MAVKRPRVLLAFAISRRGNRIEFRGQLNRSGAIRLTCACLHQAISNSGYQDVLLDFAECETVTEAVILPLIPQIVRYREEGGVAFSLTPPRSNELYRLFDNANWGHFIQPDRFDPAPDSDDHVPARRFDDHEEAYELLDEVLRFITRGRGVGPDTLQAVEWSLGEITDNVLSHAETTTGGFVQATVYESRIEFVVADAGAGIPSTLSMSDHERALRSAVTEGQTRDRSSNAGNGLFGSYQVASLSEGQFEIHSERAHLYFDRYSGGPKTRSESIPYRGTSVRCAIGPTEAQLLDRALQFEGRAHRPLFNYLERTSGTERGEMVYTVVEHAKRDLSSRNGGARVRHELESLLREEDHVVLDFEGVSVISSSFADEVFGRLFVELGPREFMSRIVLQNVDPTIDGLIDRAIVQRTRLSDRGRG